MAQLLSWLSGWSTVYLQHVYWRRVKFLDLLLFFFLSLFVGLSADRIILSFLLRKSLPAIILKSLLNCCLGISKQPGLANGSDQQSSTLLNTGENIPSWATLGMCLVAWQGPSSPGSVLDSPTYVWNKVLQENGLALYHPAVVTVSLLSWHGSSSEELPYSK